MILNKRYVMQIQGAVTLTIYTEEYIIDPSLPASTNVVLHMCEPLFSKGQTLYLDIWYTSPDLCRRVADKGTNIVGTIRLNRKNNLPRN
jgi:hypothetical protein